jgi:hypothetical protein
MTPALSIPQTITIYRQRYPEGLICTECGRLLATRRESHTKSNLTEAERLAYVCAECRLDRAEAERIHAARVERAKIAAQASAEARRRQEPTAVDRNPRPVGEPAFGDSGAQPVSKPAVYAGSEGGFLSTRSQPAVISQRRGGRPRKHPTNRAARTAAQQAWRARKRQPLSGVEVPANGLC